MRANNGHDTASTALTTLEEVRGAILHLPGRPPFMLARDLARAYGCDVKQISQATRRNPELFPEPDAFFRLTDADRSGLLQAANIGQRAPTTKLRGYTRLGANMLASFIRTRTAKERLLLIMRAFSALEAAAQAARPDEEELRAAEAYHRFKHVFGEGAVAMERVAGLARRISYLQGEQRRLKGWVGEIAAALPQAGQVPGTVAVPVDKYIALLEAQVAALAPGKR